MYTGWWHFPLCLQMITPVWQSAHRGSRVVWACHTFSVSRPFVAYDAQPLQISVSYCRQTYLLAHVQHSVDLHSMEFHQHFSLCTAQQQNHTYHHRQPRIEVEGYSYCTKDVASDTCAFFHGMATQNNFAGDYQQNQRWRTSGDQSGNKTNLHSNHATNWRKSLLPTPSTTSGQTGPNWTCSATSSVTQPMEELGGFGDNSLAHTTTSLHLLTLACHFNDFFGNTIRWGGVGEGTRTSALMEPLQRLLNFSLRFCSDHIKAHSAWIRRLPRVASCCITIKKNERQDGTPLPAWFAASPAQGFFL